jgi:hypothetical protein
MSTLVKIDPKDFGLEENKAKQIEEAFKPMLTKMVELEDEYNEIIKLEITPVTVKKAKELRLKYVKIRTGTAAIHKDLKAFYLAGGRFVDGWKNAQVFASQGVEEKLKAIEDYYENLERERILKLQEERAEKISKYLSDTDIIPNNLGEMNESVWRNLLVGTKANYDARIEAERKAEEERIENQRLDKLESDRFNRSIVYTQFWSEESYDFRGMSDNNFEKLMADLKEKKAEYDAEQAAIKAENERLKAEAEAKENARIEEEKERAKKEAAERAENEAKLEAERKKREQIEEELRAAKEATEAKERKEREERERLEKERIEAEKQAAKAPDKDKMKAAINSLSLEMPMCSTKDGERIAEEINAKFIAFKKWSNSLIETM